MNVSRSAEPVHSLAAARRGGLIDQVTEALRVQIIAGTWPVGDRIPTEPELAERTGVGRNTVREAVQALVHAGLLERRQGSGTYVRAVSELAGAVSRRLAGARHDDVVEVRRALEVEAARLAATRRTAEDAARLAALLADRQRAAADLGPPLVPPSSAQAPPVAQARPGLDALVAADVALHRGVVEAAHNPVLAELYEHLVEALAASVRHNVLRYEDDDHAALIAAVLAGDGDGAALEVGRYLVGAPRTGRD